MNSPRKAALIQEIASVLRCSIADVQDMDRLPNAKLERLCEVFRKAMNGTEREDRISKRRR